MNIDSNNNEFSINKSLIFNNLDFYDWLSGFVDAEGNFLIIIDKERKIIRFRFAIKLHIDDINVLYYIQKELMGIGIVRKYPNKYYAEYIILDFNNIKDIIIPIFEKHKLLTTKKYSFSLFAEAVKLKDNINKSKGIKLSDFELREIINIKSKMSWKNNNINENNYINIIIKPYWLLGFVEGEGTFGYKNAVPYFQLSQHSKNNHVLDSIDIFLSNLIKNNSSKLISFHMTKVINKKTSVLSYTIQDTEILSNCIVPFFSSMIFRSRKKLDFEMWVHAINIRIKGYHHIKEGKVILMKISKGTNKYRYSNYKLKKTVLPTNTEINNLFSLPTIYSSNKELTYKEQSLEYALKNNRRKGYSVYVYKEGKEIDMSPFSSYSSATKTLNIDSNIISRYIDTEKLYKNKYIFSSTKL